MAALWTTNKAATRASDLPAKSSAYTSALCRSHAKTLWATHGEALGSTISSSQHHAFDSPFNHAFYSPIVVPFFLSVYHSNHPALFMSHFCPLSTALKLSYGNSVFSSFFPPDETSYPSSYRGPYTETHTRPHHKTHEVPDTRAVGKADKYTRS